MLICRSVDFDDEIQGYQSIRRREHVRLNWYTYDFLSSSSCPPLFFFRSPLFSFMILILKLGGLSSKFSSGFATSSGVEVFFHFFFLHLFLKRESWVRFLSKPSFFFFLTFLLSLFSIYHRWTSETQYLNIYFKTQTFLLQRREKERKK